MLIFAQTKNKMNDDIFESVSQRGYGAYDEENRRIQEVSNELQRLCRLYETQSGASQTNGGSFEEEQCPLVDSDGDIYVADAEIKRIG